MRDIAVTWPKTKSLADYLAALAKARREGLVINYRVARLPDWPDAFWNDGDRPRCFVVHDGYVRGWTEILWTCWRSAGEVDGWPAGWYIVRDPEWHLLAQPIPMPGFRGWRWFDQKEVA